VEENRKDKKRKKYIAMGRILNLANIIPPLDLKNF
jgi:hypothetical protein